MTGQEPQRAISPAHRGRPSKPEQLAEKAIGFVVQRVSHLQALGFRDPIHFRRVQANRTRARVHAEPQVSLRVFDKSWSQLVRKTVFRPNRDESAALKAAEP